MEMLAIPGQSEVAAGLLLTLALRPGGTSLLHNASAIGRFQSSLWDSIVCNLNPDVETPGYSRMSLRDKTNRVFAA